MPACLLYVIFWSEALKGWIHTVYWKCLHRSQVTARTATEQQPEQSSHNRKPVLNRPAPLMVIHSAGKHTEKLFRLCYNPATGSRRWCKIGRGRRVKGSLREGIQEENARNQRNGFWFDTRAVHVSYPGQGLIMFTPSKNQVAVLKPLTMHNTALMIMSMPGLRPSTVCLCEGSVWGEHCRLLCWTQALPTDGPENTNTHSLSSSYSSSHHSVWWCHTAAAAEKPIEIKEIINKKSCIVKAHAVELQLSDCESDRGLFN